MLFSKLHILQHQRLVLSLKLQLVTDILIMHKMHIKFLLEIKDWIMFS